MPLTASVFTEFSSHYQQFPSLNLVTHLVEDAFVYVDSMGVKLVTNVVPSGEDSEGEIFALSVADDGFFEMLVIGEAS